MKIEYTAGCTCYGLDVDGEPIDDLDEAKKRAVLDRMIDAILKDYDIEHIFINLLCRFGEDKYLFTCEECGDSVYSYTLEI